MSVVNWGEIQRRAAGIGKSAVQIFSRPPVAHERKFDIRYSDGLTPIQRELVLQSEGAGDVHKNICIANICARLVAQAVASLPLQVKEDGEVIEDDPKYFLFRNPNPLYSGFEFLEFCCLQLIYKGNIYALVVGRGDYPKENPQELWPFFSSEIEPELVDFGEGEMQLDVRSKHLINLKYRYAGFYASKATKIFQKTMYDAWEIIHVREPSTDSHIKGDSWIAASSKNLKHLNIIQEFKNNVYEKGQFTKLNIHTDQEMSPEQRMDFRRDYNLTYIGTENMNQPLLTWNGMKAIPLAWSPEDLQILASEKMTNAMVATALGVPAEMLGQIIDKKNTATYREAVKQLMKFTVIPTANRILQKFSADLWPDSDRHIEINLKAIDALRPTPEDVANMSGATLNERRVIQGLSRYEEEAADIPLIPQNMALFTDLAFNGDTEEL